MDKQLTFIDKSNDTMEGFGDINAQTVAMPFIKLLQKQSPLVEEGAPEYVKNARPGLFLNTASKFLLPYPLKVIILKFNHVYLEWGADRGGLINVHSIEHAQQLAVDTTFGRWKTASGNTLAENYVYYVIVEGHKEQGPMILSLTSSNIKKAKELNRTITSHVMPDGGRARPYYLVIELTSERRENDRGSWYGIDFKFSHYINEQQYTLIKSERKAIDSYKVDYAQLSDRKEQVASENPKISAPY